MARVNMQRELPHQWFGGKKPSAFSCELDMVESLLVAVGLVILASILICAYDRWILPWKTRRWISKTLDKLRAGDIVPPAKQSDYGLSFNAVGFQIHKIRPIHTDLRSIAWSDILRVTAF